MKVKSHLAVTICFCHRALKGLVNCKESLCVARCCTKLTGIAASPFLLQSQQIPKDKAGWWCINIFYAKMCRWAWRKGASCKSCGPWKAAHCCREKHREESVQVAQEKDAHNLWCSLAFLWVTVHGQTGWVKELNFAGKKIPDFHCFYNQDNLWKEWLWLQNALVLN